MTTGLFDNKEAWREIIEKADRNRPSKGKRVKVTAGRHQGKTGVVFYHGRDRYSDAWRYATDAQAHLRDITGRWGYRVGIQADEDGTRFFCDADKVNVIEPE